MIICSLILLGLSVLFIVGTRTGLSMPAEFYNYFLLIVGSAIALLAIFLMVKLLRSKRCLKVKLLLMSPMILIPLTIFITTNIYIPQSRNDRMYEVSIDKTIPSEDLKQLKVIAKQYGQIHGVNIRYYDECQPNRPTPTPRTDSAIEISMNANPSYLCQKGDVELIIPEPNSSKHFLVRKNGQKWEVVEDLGRSYGWF